MMNVVHIDGLNGVNYHRLIAPLKRLQELGIEFYWIQSLEELKNLNLDKVDNLIVSRKVSVNNHKEFSRMLKRHGVRLILDNDDYWSLNPENPAKGLYETYYGPDIKKTIKIADVIWTPSRYLAKQMQKENPKAIIEFINNAINEKEQQWVDQRKTRSSVVRFGYLGAIGHNVDIKEIGYDFSKVYTFGVGDMGYDEVFQFNKKSEPKTSFDYGLLYKNVDVSLVPLSVNKFNLCKSDLKITEAAWTKTAVIASNTKPYNSVVRHGETGLLCRTREEWAEAINMIDKKLAKKLANNLWEDLKFHQDYNLDKVNGKRLKYIG
jgi:glycosyltransferase involved in cell wall biosynthesis